MSRSGTQHVRFEMSNALRRHGAFISALPRLSVIQDLEVETRYYGVPAEVCYVFLADLEVTAQPINGQ